MENADAATISWADHEDAWISTDAPTTYDVEDRETTWHIGSLESAKHIISRKIAGYVRG